MAASLPGAGRRGGLGRLNAIEVGRGVASAWVVLYHSLMPYAPESLHPVLRVIQQGTKWGTLGVPIFFAISGWCIAERIAAAFRRNESAASFLRDRLMRIFPMYWIALALLLATWLISAPFNQAALAQTLPSEVRGWLADVFLLNPYLGTHYTLIVAWSLPFELGFYGLAAMGLIVRRMHVGTSVLVAIGATLCLWPLLGTPTRATYVLTLWSNFFAGMLAWWCARRRTIARIGPFIVVLGFLGAIYAREPGRIAALLTALLLCLAARRDLALTSFPIRGLAKIGVFSYSLYLVHVTVSWPAMNVLKRIVPPQSGGFVLVWMLGVILAFGAGWLVHHVAEAPLERWRKRWSHHPGPAQPV